MTGDEGVGESSEACSRQGERMHKLQKRAQGSSSGKRKVSLLQESLLKRGRRGRGARWVVEEGTKRRRKRAGRLRLQGLRFVARLTLPNGPFCPILSRVSCQAWSDFDSPHVMKTLVHHHDVLQSSLGPLSFMYSYMCTHLSST